MLADALWRAYLRRFVNLSKGWKPGSRLNSSVESTNRLSSKANWLSSFKMSSPSSASMFTLSSVT